MQNCDCIPEEEEWNKNHSFPEVVWTSRLGWEKEFTIRSQLNELKKQIVKLAIVYVVWCDLSEKRALSKNEPGSTKKARSKF